MLSETYTCYIFPHPLRAERITLTPPLAMSLQDIVAQYLPDCPRDAVLIIHNGIAVQQERWCTQYINSHDTVVVRVVPMGAQTEGAANLKTIGGAVFMVAAMIIGFIPGLPPIWGWIAMGSSIVGSALSASGISYYTRMASDSLVGKSIQRPSLTGGNNSIAQNAKIPMIYGKRLIVPYYVMTPFVTISYPSNTSGAPGATEQYGRNMYLNMLYVIGYTGLDLSTMKFGDRLIAETIPYTGAVTEFGEIADCEVTVVQDGGSLPSWCSSIVKQQIMNKSLDRFDLRTVLSTSSRFTVTEHMIRNAGINWGYDYDVRLGDYVTFAGLNSGQFLKVTGVNANNIYVAKNTLVPGDYWASELGQFQRFPGEYTVTPKQTEKIEVIIEFPSGLLAWEGTAKTVATTYYRCFYRVHNATTPEVNAWLPFTNNWKDAGSTVNGEIKAAQNFTIRFVSEQAVTSGQYQVLVTRWATTVTDTKIVDSASLLSVTSTTNRSVVSTALSSKCCFVAMRARATQQLSGSLEQFNVVASSRYARTGATGDELTIRSFDRNPAAAFVHACMGQYNPRPVTVSQLDLPTLKAWALACDTNGYYCDLVEGASVTFKDTLETIAASGRAKMTVVDGKYSVIYDFQKDTIVQHITPFNSWGFSVTKKFQKFPHGVRVSFTNAAEGYIEDEVIALADGYVYDTKRDGVTRDYEGTAHTLPATGWALATEFEALSLPATTDSVKAVAMGRYYLDTIRYQDEVYTVNMDAEQLVVTAGDIVRVSYDTMNTVTSQGRIVDLVRVNAASNVTEIVVDQMCRFAYGTAYAVRVRTPDNSYIKNLVNPCTAAGDVIETKRLTIATASLGVMSDANGGDLFMFGKSEEESVRAMVVAVEIQEDLSGKLTMLKYDGRVYTADVVAPDTPLTNGVEIPPSVVPPWFVESVDRAYQGDLTMQSAEGMGAGITEYIPEAVADMAPRYLGQYTTLPVSANLYDFALKTATTYGIYMWDGSAWGRLPAPDTGVIAQAWPDICAAVNASTGTVTDYIGTGVNYAEELASMTAFINTLYGNQIVIQTGGHIRSSSVDADGTMPTSGKGFWLGADGTFKTREAELTNVTVTGSGAFNSVAISDVSLGTKVAKVQDFTSSVQYVAQSSTYILVTTMQFAASGQVTVEVWTKGEASTATGWVKVTRCFSDGTERNWVLEAEHDSGVNTQVHADNTDIVQGDKIYVYAKTSSYPYKIGLEYFAIKIAEEPGILPFLGTP